MPKRKPKLDKPKSQAKVVVKYTFSYLHDDNEIHGINDFDLDLFAIDKVWHRNGVVHYAQRLFRIKAPLWLQFLVTGYKG